MFLSVCAAHFLNTFSRSLYINLVGLWSILLCSVFAGMCLFSVYKKCDPWTARRVSQPDQVARKVANLNMVGLLWAVLLVCEFSRSEIHFLLLAPLQHLRLVYRSL